ncbi:MAG: hypothetical protein ACPH25_04535 [Schleiferiaceae bacterium]
MPHSWCSLVANRIIEIFPNGVMDKMVEYDDYITNSKIGGQREQMIGVS